MLLFLFSRWHPDLNKDLAEAHQRFQAISEAFEEVKQRQAAEEMIARNEWRYRKARSTAAGYEYSKSKFRRSTDSSFNSFRRKGGGDGGFKSGYGYEEFVKGNGRRATHESVFSFRRRGRSFETLGIGLGLFVGMSLVSLLAIGSDVLWTSINRGKSFEDVIKEVHDRPKKVEFGKRKRRREEN